MMLNIILELRMKIPQTSYFEPFHIENVRVIMVSEYKRYLEYKQAPKAGGCANRTNAN